MPSFVFYVAFFVVFSLFLYLLQPISHSKRKDFATVAFTLRIYGFVRYTDVVCLNPWVGVFFYNFGQHNAQMVREKIGIIAYFTII